LTPQQKKQLAQYWRRKAAERTERFKNIFNREVDLVALSKSIKTDLYNQYFSAEDLKNLIRFYQTPVGQK
jgi:hypothetical protein